ncbi:MAG TPA: hypothetical protein PLQ13_04875 [Candidatus Krumholzibacteria bacterium]|nr:hypothetical protein [Candidatus Krumholzibacteria bacterium]
MRRGVDRAARCAWVWPVVLACGLAVAGDGPPAVDDDLAAAARDLESLDQPPSPDDLADLLAGDPAPEGNGPWGAVRARASRGAEGAWGSEARTDGAAGPLAWHARWRRSAEGETLPAAAASWQGGGIMVLAGGWTRPSSFGLVQGGAGRAVSLAADGALAPGDGGLRAWLGGDDDCAAKGGAVDVSVGGWALGAAAGRREQGRAVAAVVGRRSGSWRLAVARTDTGGAAVGASGAWRSGPWSGAWEAAWGTPGRPSALAGHLAWSGAAGWKAEVLAMGVAEAARPGLRGELPLLGRDAGRLAAVRLKTRPAPGTALSAMAAAAERTGDDLEGREQRFVTDLVASARGAAGLRWELRLRTSARTIGRWSEAWPWSPPVDEPGRWTQSLGLAVGTLEAGAGWRVRVRSLAVDHSATTGRRLMVACEGAGRLGAAARWRLAWRTAWGAPVDLADAISPLPAVVVPRHWGHWDGGVFARLDLGGRSLGASVAADVRRGAADTRSIEAWAGAYFAW